MVAITKLFFFAALAVAAPLSGRDATTVENDLTEKIGPQLNILNHDVAAFPASGRAGALTIHTDFETLVTTLDAARTNVQNTGIFGIVSGTSILADIQLLVPTILATLVEIGNQEPSWSEIPGGKAQVLSDLQNLNTAFSNYFDAVIAAEPLLLKAGGIAVKTKVASAFTTAIAAYE